MKVINAIKAMKAREGEKTKKVRERETFFQVKAAVKKDWNVSSGTKEHS